MHRSATTAPQLRCAPPRAHHSGTGKPAPRFWKKSNAAPIAALMLPALSPLKSSPKSAVAAMLRVASLKSCGLLWVRWVWVVGVGRGSMWQREHTQQNSPPGGAIKRGGTADAAAVCTPPHEQPTNLPRARPERAGERAETQRHLLRLILRRIQRIDRALKMSRSPPRLPNVSRTSSSAPADMASA